MVLKERAEGLGYDEDFVKGIDASVFSASCGSGCPLKLAGGPSEGETVIDLGCGAGHDTLLAAKVVGRSGKVIGVDLTPEMLQAASIHRRNYSETTQNIEFVQGPLEECSSIEDSTADVVISNGVFNLCDNKLKAFQSAYRVLKPGGRLVFSDVCKLLQAVADCSISCISCVVGDVFSS